MKQEASTKSPILYWFRQDLRLTDHPLAGLHQSGLSRPVVALYIYDDTGVEGRAFGGALKWWLHHSLEAFDASIGGKLVIRRSEGDALAVLRAVVAETGATTVHWSRVYDAAGIARDTRIRTALREDGLEARSHNARLLVEPWEIGTKAGGRPFQVFTPFWKACCAREEQARPIKWDPTWTKSFSTCGARTEALDDLRLLPCAPEPDWAGGLRALWTPGEAGAQARLGQFVEEDLAGYDVARDLPAQKGTSLLSPHLLFGEISVRQIWHAVKGAEAVGFAPARDCDRFLSEIGWREFAHHLLYHHPTFDHVPLDAKFMHFPWEEDAAGLKAWQRGMTGYPIVDAGMRELWQTGWMHNRVRMIAGSFLVKDLLIPWQKGEAWFWDTLVDADMANNAAGWQWISGCGADASPWFRIFNPVLQGEKFDPSGAYVRRFVPELAELPDKWIHRPWEAPELELRAAGVRLGESYPKPIIDHGFARKRALDALKVAGERFREGA